MLSGAFCVLSRMTTLFPTFVQEQALWQHSYRRIAGIDEVGRGALAGPVVAAAVIIDPDSMQASVWTRVNDSKQLTAKQRETLEVEIQQSALCWAVGSVAASVIDRIGIAAATRQAMIHAINRLAQRPDHLLIDWVKLSEVAIPQLSLIKADAQIVSVAAASILAKVHRDRLMREFAVCFPHYGFASNKGYGAAVHLQAIKMHGPCAIHRHSFAPIAQPKLIKVRD